MNWSDDPSALAAHSPCKARLDFLQLLICRDESLTIHLRPLNCADSDYTDDADVKGGIWLMVWALFVHRPFCEES